MKVNFVIVAICFFLLLAIFSKPTDQDCINQAADLYTGKLLSPVAHSVSAVFFEVHDNLLFKTVTNRVTGEVVAHGLFNTVIKN